jgi:hypothetical protein
MDLTLEKFSSEGCGWYLRLNGRSIAVIMPSDIQKIVDATLFVEPPRNHNGDFIEPIVKAHYEAVQS